MHSSTTPLLLWKAPYDFKRQEHAKGSICWEKITASTATECSLHRLLVQKPTKTNLIFLPVTLTFPALEYNKTEVGPVEQDGPILKPKAHTQCNTDVPRPPTVTQLQAGAPSNPAATADPVPPLCPLRDSCPQAAPDVLYTETNTQVRAVNFRSHNKNSQWNRLEFLSFMPTLIWRGILSDLTLLQKGLKQCGGLQLRSYCLPQHRCHHLLLHPPHLERHSPSAKPSFHCQARGVSPQLPTKGSLGRREQRAGMRWQPRQPAPVALMEGVKLRPQNPKVPSGVRVPVGCWSSSLKTGHGQFWGSTEGTF